MQEGMTMNIFGSNVERMTADSTAPDINHGNFIHQQSLDYSSALHLTRFPTSKSDSSIRRKRRKSIVLEDEEEDSESDDDSKSVKTDADTKSNSSRPSNHSEIEKRRRDKMNKYISEISSLVPICAAMSRKLDKLTVMRYAAQHIKTLRGCVQTSGEGTYKPPCLSEEELKEMLEFAADGFVLVISCDRGRIIHVSESVEAVLGWTSQEIMGKCCFDFVVKEDAPKLKDQMSTAHNSDIMDEQQGTEVSSSTNTLVGSMSCFCPGSKRLFFCRMKRKVPSDLHQMSPAIREMDCRKSVSLRCSGFLKAWPPALTMSQQDLPSTSSEPDTSLPNFTCLVMVATPIDFSENSPFSDFSTRLTLDGTFSFCDQNVSTTLGFFPQELDCRSYYDFVHVDDLEAVSELHKAASAVSWKDAEKSVGGCYKLRRKNGSFLSVKVQWSCFRNPWTSESEFLVVSHKPDRNLNSETSTSVATLQTSSTLKSLLSKLPHSLDGEGKITGTKVGAGKIGKMVAELGRKSQSPVVCSSQEPPTKQLGQQLPSSGSSAESGQNGDEGTMSVLMSLLDAEGGVGGTTDFADLPIWPL